jgi:hypothetical protein
MSKVFLDRKEILKTEDIEVVEHEVKEWGTWVRIKVMTSKERQRFQKQIRLNKKAGADADEVPENMMETLLVLTMVDEENNPMFTSADVVRLAEKNSQALAGIFAVAGEINGLTTGAVDKAVKN